MKRNEAAHKTSMKIAQSMFSRRLSGHSQNTSIKSDHWQARHWLYAALIPTAFFISEALSILAYPAMRAPNVNIPTQIALMTLFFSLWLLVPRAIWATARNASTPTWQSKTSNIVRLIILGLGICAIHLFLLTLVLRVMHSPPGWGAAELVRSFGEVWLGNATTWMLAFAIAALLILTHLAKNTPHHKTLERLEVRQNGQTRLLALSEIFWIGAAGNYAEIHTTDGCVLVRKPLSKFADELGDAGFLKSHRSALVNRNNVSAIKPGGHHQSYVVLFAGSDKQAPLSRRHLADFKKLLTTGSSASNT